jgi:hypothetical protein
MAERLSRPPIRLNGGLPDGNNNGSGDVSAHFHTGHPAGRYAVVYTERIQLIHSDETGGDVAVLRVAKIEFPTDQDQLRGILEAHRAERTGAGMLPFGDPDPDVPDTTAATAHAQLMIRRITDWAASQEVDARAAWAGHFGPSDEEAPPGPAGATLINLLDFAGRHGIPTSTSLTVRLVGDDDDISELPDAVAGPEQPEDAPEASGDAPGLFSG